jgi:hypothetical protein
MSHVPELRGRRCTDHYYNQFREVIMLKDIDIEHKEE